MCLFKMKVAQKTGDGEENTAKLFPCSSIKKKKEEMSQWRLANRSFHGGAAGVAERCLRSLWGRFTVAVVCGQCVWVKIRPVAALGERRQDTFEAHEREAVRKIISRVLQQRPAGQDRATVWSDRRCWGNQISQAQRNRTMAPAKQLALTSAQDCN